MRELPIETLHELLRLDPETGKIYWRERGREWFSTAHACATWNTKRAGKEAFLSLSHGYLYGRVTDVRLQAHRVVFAMFHGRWPVGDVDHRDGIRTNNRPDNLRDATRQQNQRNRGSIGKTSAFCGVSWSTERQRWVAQCTNSNGRQRHLGRFADELDAARAYDAFAASQHGEFARLNFPKPQGEAA